MIAFFGWFSQVYIRRRVAAVPWIEGPFRKLRFVEQPHQSE
jgi:hypothetical protein